MAEGKVNEEKKSGLAADDDELKLMSTLLLPQRKLVNSRVYLQSADEDTVQSTTVIVDPGEEVTIMHVLGAPDPVCSYLTEFMGYRDVLRLWTCSKAVRQCLARSSIKLGFLPAKARMINMLTSDLTPVPSTWEVGLCGSMDDTCFSALCNALHNRKLLNLIRVSVTLPTRSLDHEDHARFFAGLRLCTQLMELRLSSSVLGPDGAEYLCNLLAAGAAPKLRILDLARNGLGDVGLRSIAGLVRTDTVCRKLHTLNLARNGAGDGVVAVLDALINAPRLTAVDVSDNRLNGDMLRDGVVCSHFRYLQSLDLGTNSFTPVRMAAFLGSFQDLVMPLRLTALRLAAASINNDVATSLAAVFASKLCPHLQILDLRGNDLRGPEGIREIVLAVGSGRAAGIVEGEERGCPGLIELDVSMNRLGDDGINVVVHALSTGTLNRNMQRVWVQENAATPSVVAVVARAVADLPFLTELGIFGEWAYGIKPDNLFDKAFRRRVRIV